MDPDRVQRRDWSKVDGAADAAYFLEYLRQVSAQPWAKEYKRRTFGLLDLRPGQHVIDVGCGRGDDAIALAKIVGPGGRVVGVDRSSLMLEAGRSAAKEAGVAVEFVEADAARLGLPDASFDACRIDRTLEHLADPEAALRELVRVCKPQGRIVTTEPDWDSLAIDAPDLATTRIVVHTHADDIAHGTIGRALRRMLISVGVRDVTIDQVPLAFDDFRTADAVYGLRLGLAKAVELGRVDREHADAWWRSLEDAGAAGVFWAAMLGTIAVGRKS